MKNLKNNKALLGTIAMLVGSNFYNGGQFAFHVLAGRFLGKAVYADLAAIISIFGIIGIVHGALSLSIVRSVASYTSDEQVGAFTRWISKWSFFMSLTVLIICLLTTNWLVAFLQLSTPVFGYLLGSQLFFYIILTSWRSILQGQARFGLFSISLTIESITKLAIFIVSIYLGYAIFGVVVSMVSSLLVAVLFTFIPLKKYLHIGKEFAPDLTGFLKYSMMALLQGLALTMMYSTDLLLVKHYFSADQAGVYTSLSVLGRIVFFGITPITQVMFPMVVKKVSENQKYIHLFYLSIGFVIAMVMVLIAVYYFIPAFIINLLYGSAYTSGAGMLWWFALSLGLLGISNVFIQFFLSVGRTKIVSWFFTAAVVQILLIISFHSSLLQVIQVTALSDALLLSGLLLYFPYHNGHKKT